MALHTHESQTPGLAASAQVTCRRQNPSMGQPLVITRGLEAVGDRDHLWCASQAPCRSPRCTSTPLGTLCFNAVVAAPYWAIAQTLRAACRRPTAPALCACEVGATRRGQHCRPEAGMHRAISLHTAVFMQCQVVQKAALQPWWRTFNQHAAPCPSACSRAPPLPLPRHHPPPTPSLPSIPPLQVPPKCGWTPSPQPAQTSRAVCTFRCAACPAAPPWVGSTPSCLKRWPRRSACCVWRMPAASAMSWGQRKCEPRQGPGAAAQLWQRSSTSSSRASRETRGWPEAAAGWPEGQWQAA